MTPPKLHESAAGTLVSGPTGTRAIERAVQLLRTLSERGQQGWRISDLSARVGLPLGTCHRILDALLRERLAMRSADGARYHVGPLMLELASARPGWIDLPSLASPRLRELARCHRAVAFLYARSGDDFVCLARESAVEMRALAVERGTRRPLITSSGGAAILVMLRARERRLIVASNIAQLQSFGDKRVRGVQSMLRDSIRCGYGLNLARFVAGVHSLGVAVCDTRNGTVLGAVVLSGAAERLPAETIQAIYPQCKDTANKIAEIWMTSLALR